MKDVFEAVNTIATIFAKVFIHEWDEHQKQKESVDREAYPDAWVNSLRREGEGRLMERLDKIVDDTVSNRYPHYGMF